MIHCRSSRAVFYVMPTPRILIDFASVFFLASGCWSDLLIIRVFLTCAYAFILAFYFSIRPQSFPESFVLGFACLYLQGSSAVRLFLDEGPVKLEEEKEQVCYKPFATMFCWNFNSDLTYFLMISTGGSLALLLPP